MNTSSARSKAYDTSMDHVTLWALWSLHWFFSSKYGCCEWHGQMFVKVSIWHQQKTQTTSTKHVHNLLFLGVLAAMKFLTLLLLLSCIRYTWRVASAESFMGNHEGSYPWSLTVEPTMPDLCHYVANARGQCSFCFLWNGSLEPLILKSWLRLLLCNPDVKGIHWTPKMFVVCLQTPWILPACWQDGSMIASVCVLYGWMSSCNWIYDMSKWNHTVCGQKKASVDIETIPRFTWFSPFPSVQDFVHLSSRIDTQAALKGPVYLRLPYSPTSLSCMVCQPQVTSSSHIASWQVLPSKTHL